jgi:glycosyltransferase involved in cell wall biosynthesis
MNEKPLISVILITYNQEQYIRQALDGIMAQETDYPFEVIIGEDYGTDNTRAICQEYVSKFPMIRFAPQDRNLGVTGNWINCINHSKGKYFIDCAGDDYWSNPKKIQIQADFMESNPDCVVCITDYDTLYVKSGKIVRNTYTSSGTRPMEGRIQKEILSGSANICSGSFCIRKETFDRFIPTQDFVRLAFPREDWPALIILTAHGDLRYIPVSTITYRVGQESITRTSDYEEIINRAQQDKVMTEYLFTLFPEWGPFKDGLYFDHIGYHNAMLAAYRNNDYAAAHKFAKKDKYPSWATYMAYTKLTYKIFHWIQIKRHRL